MDEKKEKETQAELESSANSDPVSDAQETDQDLESLAHHISSALTGPDWIST